jgi:hypothetical protein
LGGPSTAREAVSACGHVRQRTDFKAHPASRQEVVDVRRDVLGAHGAIPMESMKLKMTGSKQLSIQQTILKSNSENNSETIQITFQKIAHPGHRPTKNSFHAWHTPEFIQLSNGSR